jgi:hypothetical protein
VSNPFLGFYFSRGDGLRRKLEHRCFLTLPQISQQDHLPIGKFQRIMMRSRVVLVDLPEDSRRVIDYSWLPRKQPSWPARYSPGKGKFRPRNNANRRIGIFRCSKPTRAGIEVPGCQFLTHLGRT